MRLQNTRRIATTLGVFFKLRSHVCQEHDDKKMLQYSYHRHASDVRTSLHHCTIASLHHCIRFSICDHVHDHAMMMMLMMIMVTMTMMTMMMMMMMITTAAMMMMKMMMMTMMMRWRC